MSQAEIECDVRRDLPFVLDVAVNSLVAPASMNRFRHNASLNILRNIEQKRGERIRIPVLGCRVCCRRGLWSAERKCSSRMGHLIEQITIDG